MTQQLTQTEQTQLLRLARDTLAEYLKDSSERKIISPNAAHYPKRLSQRGCAFVSLHRRSDNALRGCIGSLAPHRALVEDVAANCVAAASTDPRFSPVTHSELPDIYIEISVLSPQVLMSVESEADLLQQLRPNVDGLTIDDGRHRATFLPLVWSQLPQAKDFLRQLKLKAGLKPDAWPEQIQCYRYQAEAFSEPR